ncbi:hypothetical protein MLD63_15690 [Paracoccus sp. TK19116]|uniref:Tetratricopeptide repeat protein n=1 Tax=Paracoccus albicereus TaxID=2922394 RepID=A0ABT1MU48_9RHOB|nr:hypothetical protein [Paracoccus albicereus]MCQ0971864.1 hypothetical protein [Paracoccus albicereus]
MPADPVPQSSIAGFRQDRIGARIVGLLNVLRLERDFGAKAQFLWLAEPHGPYPELADPRDFLDADFVDRHITLIGERADLSARRNLMAEAARMDRAHFKDALAKGALFHSDAAFGILRMIDESPDEVRASVARITADLPLAPRLAAALDRARERLAQHWGGTAPLAIHVRRGDLLDGLPWSLSSWPAKYVPDEFFRAWVASHDGPVIAFSDTPAAIAHLAQGNPRIVPVGDLLDDAGMLPAQRDVLDLMLMAGCTRVGAPSGSAFSRAAEIVGLATVDSLPADLPTDLREAAHDALLDRALSRPDSFFAPGDLAQSLQYAAPHAVAAGRAGDVMASFAAQETLCAAHPFVRRLLAATAMSDGDHEAAMTQVRLALEDPRLQRRDRLQCQHVKTMADLVNLSDDDPRIDAAFLSEIFLPRNYGRPFLPQLAARALGRTGRAGQALLLPVRLAKGLSAPAPADEPRSTQPDLLPEWCYLSDWEELLPNDRARQSLRLSPGLNGKLSHVGCGAEMIEAITADQSVSTLTSADGDRVGLHAACLSLHGRYRRALELLHWLDRQQPGDVLTLKRIADTCFRIGNLQAGMETLDRALALDRENPLMQLSKARRMAQQRRPKPALFHLSRAEGLWPGLDLMAQQRKLVERALTRPRKT